MTEKKSNSWEDPHDRASKRKGIMGIFETIMRRFRLVSFTALLAPLVFIYIFCLSVAILPGAYFSLLVYEYFEHQALILPYVAILISLCIAVTVFGFLITLLLVVPLCNLPFLFMLRSLRATWYSLSVIPWYYHNALVQLVRFTVLDLVTPTPLTQMYYRMMGMKIGKNTMINTSNISDPGLITIGDNVTIGGSATVFAHYGMKGFLIIGHTVIGNNVTIGLKASVMGNVIIGDGVTVAPHNVILPKTRLFKDVTGLHREKRKDIKDGES
ncbi:hypothetical protein OAB57_01355 [Bacteriovoracaceae bacterium]|nr:hypothetical protein [Bacteriovoracaceae bacterium]